MMMDPATVERLAREHPEGYRGGGLDQPVLGHLVSAEKAWRRASRCLDADQPGYYSPARAAYWAGFAGAVDDTDA